MDFTYRVDMKHQWRPGIGGFVDLNCGWYCQGALLNWYCNKNELSYLLYNNLPLITRIKRLASRAICFSRSVELHEKVIGAFIEKYMFY